MNSRRIIYESRNRGYNVKFHFRNDRLSGVCGLWKLANDFCRASTLSCSHSMNPLMHGNACVCVYTCMIYRQLNFRGAPNLKFWSKYGVGGVPCKVATSCHAVYWKIRMLLVCTESACLHFVCSGVKKFRGETRMRVNRIVVLVMLYSDMHVLAWHANTLAFTAWSCDKIYDGNISCWIKYWKTGTCV